MKAEMPGEDNLIRGQQELAAGLKDIFGVFNNFITTIEVPVEKGSTLWALAKAHLGDGQRWRELFLMNLDHIFREEAVHHATVGGPDLIYIGDKLRLMAF